jgi:hypothetical protein
VSLKWETAFKLGTDNICTIPRECGWEGSSTLLRPQDVQ